MSDDEKRRLRVVTGSAILLVATVSGVAIAAPAVEDTYNGYVVCTPPEAAGQIHQDAFYNDLDYDDVSSYIAVGEDAVWVREGDTRNGLKTFRYPVINKTQRNGSTLVAIREPASSGNSQWLLLTDDGIHVSDGRRPTAKNSNRLMARTSDCDGAGVSAAEFIRGVTGKPHEDITNAGVDQ